MKWNVFLGTLVLGFGLCAQSYGFDLLDRMLGVGGCGCDPCAVKSGCGQKDGCCQKNGKGCSQKDGCCQKNGNGCCQKDGKGCGQKGSKGGRQLGLGNLFDRIFVCNRCGGGKGKGKGSKGCCDEPVKADDKDKAEDAPMPPAPVVDPSAFLQTRRVVPASHIVR